MTTPGLPHSLFPRLSPPPTSCSSAPLRRGHSHSPGPAHQSFLPWLRSALDSARGTAHRHRGRLRGGQTPSDHRGADTELRQQHGRLEQLAPRPRGASPRLHCSLAAGGTRAERRKGKLPPAFLHRPFPPGSGAVGLQLAMRRSPQVDTAAPFSAGVDAAPPLALHSRSGFPSLSSPSHEESPCNLTCSFVYMNLEWMPRTRARR